MSKNKFLLYKIYYSGTCGDIVAYLGRTKQPINARLRGHFFKMPMHKMIDIFSISKIEVAECKTEADMFLYEIYYINRFKPALNRDDKAEDELTFTIPELDFQPYNCNLLDKWKNQLRIHEEVERENQHCLIQ